MTDSKFPFLIISHTHIYLTYMTIMLLASFYPNLKSSVSVYYTNYMNLFTQLYNLRYGIW